jgi:hypothetical protein
MNKRISVIVFVFALVALPAFPAAAKPDDAVVVEAEGQVTLGDDSTIGQAKAAALNNARRAALEKATGVEVRGSSVVYNYQLINDLVVTASKGFIVRERIIENKCKSQEEHFYCTARIEAAVKPLHVERRGDFAVTKAVVHRVDSDASKHAPVFQNKDEIQIRVMANQDSYLSIFSVDQYGNVARLYPNEFAGYEVLLPAGKELSLPDALQRQSGLKLRVSTPKGVKKSVESVLVVALKEKKHLLAGGVENPTIMDLMQELSNMDPSLWVEKAVGYEVRE